MPIKLLPLDPDLLEVTRAYVEAQLGIMRQYDGEPVLPDGGVDALVQRCGQYPQKVRNLTRKLAARKRRRKK